MVRLAIYLLILFCGNALEGQAQVLLPIESPAPEAGGHFGWSVAPLGDVNGDTVPDLLVGAPGESVDGIIGAGRAYVVSGSDLQPIHSFASPLPVEDGRFGWDVSLAFDLTKDGIPEVAVGAPGEHVGSTLRAGFVHVFSGQSGELLLSIDPFKEYQDGAFGTALAPAGDRNQDGVPDLVVGSPGPTTEEPEPGGGAFVHSGIDGRTLAGELFSGLPVRFGTSIASTDLNEDKQSDYCGGAPGSFIPFVRCFLSGSPQRTLAFNPPQGAQEFGRSLVTLEDRDDDGTSDLFIGSRGEAFLYSGESTEMLTRIAPPDGSSSDFGRSLNDAGDVNGDGQLALFVGAPLADVDGSAGAGTAAVFESIAGSRLFQFRSPNPTLSGWFGWDVTRAGDVDADGREDLLVGAPGEIGEAGRAYLVLTGATVSTTPEPAARMELTAAPNPAVYSLRLDVSAEGIAQLVIYDSLGRRVWRAESLAGASHHLHVSTWEAGVYLAVLQSGDSTITTPFIIAR
ncbi:MAG: T9SS type A sorting domain-containing protein [Bacteroidota bacterium]